MIIYANGCSMTLGAELGEEDGPENVDIAYRAKYCAIGQLGEMFDATVINDSLGGASNDRIVRTTTDWILENYEKTNLLVIIGWTDPYRKEIVVDDAIMHNVVNQEYPFVQISHSFFDRTKLGKHSKKYYDLYCNEIHDFYLYLQQIILLQSLLESYEIPYVFYSGLYNVEGYFDNIGHLYNSAPIWQNDKRLYMKNMERLVDKIKNNVRFYKSCMGFHDMFEKRPELLMKNHHPNEIGHKMFADDLYEYIKTNNLF